MRRFSLVITALTSGLSWAEEIVISTSSGTSEVLTSSANSGQWKGILNSENIWGLATDGNTGNVYFSSPTSGKIHVAHHQSLLQGEVETFIFDPSAVFHGVAVANQQLFALNSSTDELLAYPLDRTRPGEVIADGFMRPNDVAIDTERNRFYVSDSGHDLLHVFSFQQRILLKTYDLEGAWGIAVDETTGDVYLSSHDLGTLSKIEWDSGQLSVILAGLEAPRGLTFDRYRNLIIKESGSGRYVELNLNNQTTSNKVVVENDNVAPVNGHDLIIRESEDFDHDFLNDDWEISQVGQVDQIRPGVDSDFDGIDPLIEYAFNGSTSQADLNFWKTFDLNDPGEGTLSLDVVDDQAIKTAIQISNDLENWVTIEHSSAAPSPAEGYLRYSFDFVSEEVFGTIPKSVFVRAGAYPDR